VSGFAAMQRQLPRRLVGVWAHPDDEAYLSAGLMARIVQTGGAVTIVTLTDGEGGFPADDQRPVRVRVQQRRLEMRAAMAEIGVTDIRFLGVADGGVAAASAQDIVASIASVMNEVRPDLVVTFGPDGITGHEDHIANWRLATSAWLSCGHGALWYAAKTQSWLDEWRDLHDRFGVWMTDEQKGISNSDVQSVVDLDPRELARKRRVLAAHASQTAGLAAAFGEDRYRKWIRQEVFRPANAADLGAADDLAVTRSAELLAMVA
jgi:LmbE family N-acetylglucosaminyl deacetylase